MKKFAIILILIMVCAIPVSAKTCRNGRMTVYHNSEFGYYPNNHVYTNNAYPNNHVYNNGDKKPKPVYTHRPISNRPAVSQRPITGAIR